MNYAMDIKAAFAILHTHNCSTPTTLPWVQQWRSDAFTPAHKCQFLLQQKWVVVDAGCWHILNQLKSTTTCRHVLKKHIRKKPILLLCTVKMEGDRMCSKAIASDKEPSSGRFPLFYISNVGTGTLSTDHTGTTSQRSFRAFLAEKKTSSVLFPPPTSKAPHTLICSISLTKR